VPHDVGATGLAEAALDPARRRVEGRRILPVALGEDREQVPDVGLEPLLFS